MDKKGKKQKTGTGIWIKSVNGFPSPRSAKYSIEAHCPAASSRFMAKEGYKQINY